MHYFWFCLWIWHIKSCIDMHNAWSWRNWQTCNLYFREVLCTYIFWQMLQKICLKKLQIHVDVTEVTFKACSTDCGSGCFIAVEAWITWCTLVMWGKLDCIAICTISAWFWQICSHRAEIPLNRDCHIPVHQISQYTVTGTISIKVYVEFIIHCLYQLQIDMFWHNIILFWSVFCLKKLKIIQICAIYNYSLLSVSISSISNLSWQAASIHILKLANTHSRLTCGQGICLADTDPSGQYHPASQSAMGAASPDMLQYWPGVQGVGSQDPFGQYSPGWHSPPFTTGCEWKNTNLINWCLERYYILHSTKYWKRRT